MGLCRLNNVIILFIKLVILTRVIFCKYATVFVTFIIFRNSSVRHDAYSGITRPV
jgi:hypothetical protein